MMPPIQTDSDDYWEQVTDCDITKTRNAVREYLSGVANVHAGARKHPDQDFISIMWALVHIKEAKEALYGSHFEKRCAEPKRVAHASIYFDFKRKFERLQNIMEEMIDGDGIPTEAVMDTYLDLAVYGALALRYHYFTTERNDEDENGSV